MGYREPSASWLGSPNYSQGRPGGISWIVLHTEVGTNASANARFQNIGQAASAHYGVGMDGSLVQWVDEGDTAWHAGDFACNQASIGIEHEDGGNYNSPRPDALYARSAALVAAICKRYNIPIQRGNYAGRIAGCIDHRTVYATGCPDSLDTDRIIREAGALFSGSSGSLGDTDMTPQEHDWLAEVRDTLLGDPKVAGHGAWNAFAQNVTAQVNQVPAIVAALATLEAEIKALPAGSVAAVDLKPVLDAITALPKPPTTLTGKLT